MTSFLLRNMSFQSRRIRLSHSLKPSFLSLSKPTSFFSSRSSDSPPPPISHTHDNKNQQSLDLEEISNEELKRRVARIREGDEDAIPAVFEAVLQRYLTGKPIDADQDLMKEILGQGTESRDYDEEEEEENKSDSDLEGMSDSDFEDEEDFNLDVKPRSRVNEEKPNMK